MFFAREKWTNFYAKSLPSDQLTKTVFETKREPLCKRKVGHIGHKKVHLSDDNHNCRKRLISPSKKHPAVFLPKQWARISRPCERSRVKRA